MEAVKREAGDLRPPGSFRTRIVERRRLSSKTVELILARPPGFEFSAGQRISLTCAGNERDYSLASAPAENDLRLCVRSVAGGRLSPQLSQAEPGCELAFTGPHGYFIFQASGNPVVWVATGTGVAPFRAMAVGGRSDFTLLHGVDSPEELYYRDDLRPRAAQYVACLSGVPGSALDAFRGRVTDYLEKQLPAGRYDFYLCGRRDMIRDATLLIDERYPQSRVYAETFY